MHLAATMSQASFNLVYKTVWNGKYLEKNFKVSMNKLEKLGRIRGPSDSWAN